ncbi:hypothetical protein [Polyangium jinanense]|uniref:Uncharacterized protein n=1 Tax=Polyangium jinanense TaxID=2829994 RepID=A0A9X4APM7_9BACT|nr:hypothetical protein [Polyangium jinanense]MDC3953418.1 hypothetical protein [Polyangium jinanense]MDC3979461.1 hypothetical protein [Polyangium jinanense]
MTTTFDALHDVAEAPLFPRDRPLPPTLTVRQARDAYLAENGFTTDEYTAETFSVMIFGGRAKVTLPNPPPRRWAIGLHDLHHVATGYGANLIGEGEIALWELMGGCETWIVYLLNASAAMGGFVLSPRRMLQAYRDARPAKALYRQGMRVDELLDMPLGDLRERLGIPREGLAKGERAVAAKPRA